MIAGEAERWLLRRAAVRLFKIEQRPKMKLPGEGILDDNRMTLVKTSALPGYK
jgi:hypothetical protein